MRRVVLVAYYYPPMGGAAANRALGFARHLPAHGYAATVVAPVDGTFGRDPSLPRDLPPPGRVIRCLSPEPATLLKRAAGGSAGGGIVEPVALGRGGSRLRRLARTWAYVPDAQAPWIPFAALAAIRASRGASAIVSSGPPVSAHVAAFLAARATGRPWIADVRDLWSPWAARRARLDRGLLDGLLRRAARVVTVSEGFAELLADRTGRPRDAIAVIPNGFDPDDHPAERTPPARFTLTFTGLTHGERQDLAAFLDAVAEMLGDGRLARDRFRLRIVGRLDPYSRARIARAGLEDVVVDEGFSTHRAAAVAQRDATALLLLLWSAEDEVRPGVRPAKLPEYLGARRPVLALGDPECEAARVLVAAGAGATLRFDDADGIAARLGALFRTWEREGDLPDLAASANLREHTRAHGAGRLAAVLDAAGAGAGRPSS